MDTADRIFELVDRQYKEQREFAAELGLDPTIVSRWKLKKSTSYKNYLPQIANVLHTSAEYLLTGEETKKALPAQRSKEDMDDLLDQMSPQELAEVIQKATVRLAQLDR